METNKLALVLVSLFVGCGLDTFGMGEVTDDGQLDVELDTSETDVAEDIELDEGILPDDSGLEDFGGDEVAENVVDVEADTVEDAGEDEADDDEAEDGGIIDPCILPEIPTAGLWLWYCIPITTVSIDMTVMRWVDRPSGSDDIPWHFAPGCSRASTRELFCSLADYGAASVYYFNITTPGFEPGWSCGPGLEVTHGVPRIFWNGVELAVFAADNESGGCNHTFEIPVL